MSLLQNIKDNVKSTIETNVPPGWRTIFQIQKEEAPGSSIESVRGTLRIGIGAGLVDVKKFRAPYLNTVRTLNCYKEIKK